MCFDCLYIHQGLKLKNREWICPKCGEKHDRDVNAAKNIKRQGLNLLNYPTTMNRSDLATKSGNNRGNHGDGSGSESKTCLNANSKKHSAVKRETKRHIAAE